MKGYIIRILSYLALILSTTVSAQDTQTTTTTTTTTTVTTSNSGKVSTELHKNTCSTDDLNHSILIECKSTNNCNKLNNLETKNLWPKSRYNVNHISSSRSGDRFEYKSLTRLNEFETLYSKFIDINTTIYINTNEKFQKIHGFGTSLNLALNSLNHNNNNANLESILKSFKPIIKDLFSNSQEGNNFSILRLTIDYDNVMSRFNMSTLLYDLDKIFGDAIGGSQNSNFRINIILSFNALEQSHKIIDSLKLISESCNQNESDGRKQKLNYLNCGAISVPKDWILSSSNSEGWMDFLETTLFSEKILLLSELKISDGPNFLDKLTTSQSKLIRGLLAKSEYSMPYNILEYLHSYKSNKLKILSIASDKYIKGNFGDWQNAQNYAMELLKHFKYGSNGFIEEFSSIDVLHSPDEASLLSKNIDSSIYNLHESHGLHYRGPIYYAMGHFSRFVTTGSIKLGQIISTQPNSFGSDSISFLTPDNYVVVIALNNNDHMLQYKIVIDNYVVTTTNIEPKSFNSFIIKL